MNAAALALAPAPAPAPHNAGPRVLHGRDLRPGAELAATSGFDDACWNLAPAILQRHERSLVLDFDRLPAAHRHAGKQLFYALLSGPLPPGVPRRSITTIRSCFSKTVLFLNWVDARPAAGRGPRTLAGLTPADLEDFSRHLHAVSRTRGHRAATRAAVRLLWHCRAQLGDKLSFDPAHLDSWGEPHHASEGENSTDRIPEPVMGALLTWALRFVDDFAADILPAADEARALKSADPFKRGARTPTVQEVTELLEGYEQDRKPLPGFRGKPNTCLLARRLGCYRTMLTRSSWATEMIAATAARVGVDADSYLDAAMTATLDDRPWLDRVAYSTRGDDSIGTLARMLQTACYMVIAYLSGMRDGEIKHLERGSISHRRDSTGTAYRVKITSLAFKGESDPAGTPATWVVGRPVERAVAVLEQLQSADTALLFAKLPFREGHRPGSTNQAHSTAATKIAMADFITWVNTYCDRHGRADGIPDHHGRPWRLTTRQFRRTLAWHIAHRPGGTIAGAIAYRHLGIQMFEGYAGTSDSGFRSEVESEQAIARGEHLLAMIDEHEHFTGPAADTAARRLDAFAGRVVTDPRRLKRLMTRNDPAIYPGAYVTCVYDPAKALCGPLHAELADCQPLACRNVALTGDNRDALRQQITDLEHHLAHRPEPAPYLAHLLTARRDAIAAFLSTNTPETA